MSADLVQEVAEALYNLEPLVTGYGDRERKLTWTEAQYEGYSGKYLRRAEAAIGYVSHGYDLLAEAPKPPITLPSEEGTVIRYRAPEGFWEVAHRFATLPGAWRVDGLEESFSDEGVLARILSWVNPDGFEVATWTKPGDQK
ncbi:MAG: hypothetical protein L0G87_01330 [Renibacterium salmoninarum]|nr:hypothetical protein [Renibacterium salmoninarum]